MSVTSSALIGRIVALSGPREWKQVAREAAFGLRPRLQGTDVGFCSDHEPHDGEIDGCHNELAYADPITTHVSRMWIRTDNRVVPQSAIKDRARAMALERHPDLHLESKSALEPWMEKAKEELFDQVIAKRRITEVLVFKDFAWIGAKAPDSHRELIDPNLVIKPVLWHEETGWEVVSMVILKAFTQRKNGELCPGVTIEEIDAHDKTRTVKVHDRDKECRELIAESMKKMKSIQVDRVRIRADLLGSPVVFDADRQGMFRAEPPSSTGGLEADQICRRFKDLGTAAWRIREAIKELEQSL